MNTWIENTSAGPRAQADRDAIPGWGADLDPAGRPAVPKERTPPRLDPPGWDSPEAQVPKVEILHSIERPGISPVFGSGQPPSGLSGVLRRRAFRYSESDLRHWMLLLLADRINVGEGLLHDVSHGHVPNIPAEMGLRAVLAHDRAATVRKAAVLGGLVLLAAVYLTRRR